MLDINISTTDFEQVRRKIEALEADLQRKANLAGLRAIAKPLRRDLASSLPVKSGALARSIGYKTLSKRRMGQIGLDGDDAVEVAATRKVTDKSGKRRHQTYKLRFLSYGTAAHTIKARPGKFLKLQSGHFVKEVQHGGIQGKDYLRKVYDKHQSHMAGLFIRGAHSVMKKHGVELL